MTSPLTKLSATEAETVNALTARLNWDDWRLRLRDSYFKGEQAMSDLGISIPPSLRDLRTAIGWPRVGIEAVADRLEIETLRYADSDEYDDELATLCDRNDLVTETGLGMLDALVMGRYFLVAGTNEDDDENPLISAESPLQMAVRSDNRKRQITAAFQRFRADGRTFGVLMLPNENVVLSGNDFFGNWTVEDRDEHGLGFVSVERVANRARLSDRIGSSDITPEIMNLTDAGCRTLLGADVQREFFGAPQRWIMGASEDAFKKSDGSFATAWETYIGRVLALEADEDGNLPTVGTFAAGDPTVNTKLIDMYAKLIAGLTGLPASWYGYVTDGNPASADAIRSHETRLDRRVDRKYAPFGTPVGRIAQKALAIKYGVDPRDVSPIRVDWVDTRTKTPVSDADAVSKQAAAQAVTGWSPVVLKRLGYTGREIQQLQRDRKTQVAEEARQAAIAGLQARQSNTPPAANTE